MENKDYAAIFKLGTAILQAADDGIQWKTENSPAWKKLINIMTDLDADPSAVTSLVGEMTLEQAFTQIKNLPAGRRLWVRNIIEKIITADGEITNDESNILNNLIKKCNLPPITPYDNTLQVKDYAAVWYLSYYILKADEVSEGNDSQTAVMVDFIPKNQLDAVGSAFKEMSLDEAKEIVAKLSEQVRIYIRDILLFIITADNLVSDDEMERFNSIAKACNLHGEIVREAKKDDERKSEKKDVESDDTEDNMDEDESDDDGWIDCSGDVVVNGIFYNIYDDTATAAFFDDDEDYDQPETLVIPSHVKYKGKNIPVTSFSISDGEYKKLVLPPTIKSVCGGAFGDMEESQLRNMTIDLQGNENIVFVDGVFYSKDMKNLQCAAFINRSKEYTIRDGVEQIWNSAFENKMGDEIVTLNIPKSVKQIDSPFNEDGKLKTVNIYNTESNVKFYDEEPGVESFSENVKINYIPNVTTNATETVEKKEKVVYVFKGVDYKKKTDLVQAVVRDYIEEHDVTTIEELKQVFDVRVKKGIPMVLSLDDALKTTNSAGEAGGSFAISEEMQIPLKKKGFLGIKTGVKVVVWRYWPERFFDSFLELALRIGCKIEVKK